MSDFTVGKDRCVAINQRPSATFLYTYVCCCLVTHFTIEKDRSVAIKKGPSAFGPFLKHIIVSAVVLCRILLLRRAEV